jgi:uncharacterized OsmC-like protein
VSEELLINSVRSYTTGTPGRSINAVRGHHFVIDEPTYAGGPGEEVTPGDAFLAGVSACGVLLVEAFARQTNIPFQKGDVTIQGIRTKADPTQFQRIAMRFELVGPTQPQAEQLVERYKSR